MAALACCTTGLSKRDFVNNVDHSAPLRRVQRYSAVSSSIFVRSTRPMQSRRSQVQP